MILNSRTEAEADWRATNAPISDISVRLHAPNKCICNGAKRVGGNFAVGHPDFAKGVDCICAQKEHQNKLRNRWREESGLDDFDFKVRTFGTWNRKSNPQCNDALEAAVAWSQQEDSPANLFLVGSPGLGKTHLSKAAVVAALGSGVRAVFVTASDFAEYSRQEMGAEAAPYLKLLLDVPMLVIDDLGREHVTDFIVDRMYRLFNWREGRYLPTMITTNHSAAELGEIYSPALISRLSQGRVEILIGDDQRRTQ